MSRPDIRDPDQWIPRDLFAAYCGEDSGPLLEYYDKAKAKRKPILWSFDWLAFFVLPAWLGYRRQWVLYAALIGSIAVVTVVADWMHVRLPSGAFGGALIALALTARGLLFTNANGAYFKLKRAGIQDDGIRQALANKAKRSPGLAVAGLFGAFIVQTIAFVATR